MNGATFVATATLLLATPASALSIPGVTVTELAGRALGAFPFFEYARTFTPTPVVYVALDGRFLATQKICFIYIVTHKSDQQWAANPALVDVRSSGADGPFIFYPTNIVTNTKLVTNAALLSGAGGANIAIGYDVVLDCNANAVLDSGDYIDGAGTEAGFYVALDTVLAGPYAVVSAAYNVQGTAIPQAKVYYPSTVASLGMLPLVTISHGADLQHTQYSQLASHLASYGYIVVTHGTDALPGPNSASTSTLEHTLAFIALQGVIAGGVLVGHIDANRIVWIGHSVGGEGIVVAYHRLANGEFPQPYYGPEDFVLVSSMSPTTHRRNELDPPSVYDVPYSLWLASADHDTMNHPVYLPSLSPELWSRAEGYKQVISIYGAGHGAYIDSSLPQYGPCPRTHADELAIVKGYAVPLLKAYTDGNIAAQDFLSRQWEVFRPKGVPLTPSPASICGAVNLTYSVPASAGTFVLDNYTTNPSLTQSSAGTTVGYTVQNTHEGRLRDRNISFAWLASAQECRCTGSTSNLVCDDHSACAILDTYCACSETDCVCAPGRRDCSELPSYYCSAVGAGSCSCTSVSFPDPMNGLTYSDLSPSSRGVTFDWTGSTERHYRIQIPVAQRDLRNFKYLSFRAAQTPRHPFTAAALGDLDFSVELEDSAGRVKTIRLSTLSAAIEEPYQRNTPIDGGIPPGWAAEFETVRIRLEDFLNNNTIGFNLGNVVWVRFRFSGSVGATTGRIVLDDVELTHE